MKKLKNIGFWLIFFAAIYLFICIVHLSWYIGNPEGFWSFWAFIDIIKICFIILIFIALTGFGVFLFFDQIIKLIHGKLKVSKFIKGIGLASLFGIIFFYNSFISIGVSYFFNSKMAEKYSYLERSEELIYKKKYNEATNSARIAYLNQKKEDTYWIFFLTKLWTQSNYNQKNQLLAKYEATINYAYCMDRIDGKSFQSEQLYNEALKILDNKLFSKLEKNDRSFFTYLSLSNIKFEQKHFANAEVLFYRALNSLEEIGEKDFNYVHYSYLLMLDRTSRNGDWIKQKELCYELLEVSKKAGMGVQIELELLQILITTELLLENFTKVSSLVLDASSIAEESEDIEVYNQFQLNKANYFLALAEKNQKDKNFAKKNGFWLWLLSSEEKKLTNRETSLLQAKTALLEIVDLSFKPKGNYFNDLELNAYISFSKLLILNGKNNQAYQALKKITKYINPKSTNKVAEEINFTIALLESNQSHNKTKIMQNMVNNKFNDFYNQFAVLNELDRENLLLNFEKKINILHNYFLRNKSQENMERILNNSLRIKELSLISQIQIKQYLKTQNNPKFKVYESLSEEYLNIQNSKSFKDRLKIEKVRSQLFALHQELNMNDVLMKGLKLDNTWNDVRTKLTNEELAVDIIRVPNQNDSKVIYYALLFSSNSKKPELVKLFYESELEGILNCPGNTKERINCILETKAYELNNLIFEPMSKYMVNKKIIYISKTGLLHKVPFGSITLDKDWTIKSVSSLQRIDSKDINFGSEGVDLFGGANFAGFNTTQRNFGYQISIEVQEKLRKEKITNLPHSKKEVLAISKLYKSLGRNFKLYIESEANEYSFRKLSGGKKDIIHVATHGFSEGLAYNVNSHFNLNNNASSELLRSGIILSPQKYKKDLNNETDGLITAMDISQLDFSNYNLAIFSSCESGLGNLYGNQGVYGIVRGLKLAGTKSMILSLWQVPDKHTSELMIIFYKYYLKGDHPNDALKKAKLELKAKYPNPYYWAGFEYFE